MSAELVAEFPEKLQFLFVPSRYKVGYGGRGSGKSWAFARALLIEAAKRPLRILCARETQKSLSDSVHTLLSDQVQKLGLSEYYEVNKSTLVSRCGSEFLFAGLRHNINNIKSVESCDIVWVEEAQAVSKQSWEVLIPTIRKPRSEIWITFNPELATDYTYERFVAAPPPNATVVKLNWPDNPWFPDVLREEARNLKERDPDAYLHVYEGHCKQNLEGAVYAKELRVAETEGRICRVPYDAMKPVSTFWDLGFADSTSIWFAQTVGFEYRLIDYVEGSQKKLADYLQILQTRGYVYDTHYLPHDAKARQLGSGKSIQELMKEAGCKVRVLPRLSIADGMNAARTVFGQCYFDDLKCADGLQALRHYRFEWVPDLGRWSDEPLHDWASHCADAFRQFAVAIKQPARDKERRDESRPNYGPQSWMS